MEESIYNILPPKEMKLERGPKYVSKHTGSLKPTGSTFGQANTTIPGISNLAGESNANDHGYNKPRAHFGYPPCSRQPDPKSTYLKKQSPSVDNLATLKKTNPDALKVTRARSMTKPGLPDKSDKPIMNLVTSKNFIVSNAVEVILAKPRQTSDQEPDFMNKEDFGQVPVYLQKIKKDIQEEYDYIRKLREDDEAANVQSREMSIDEKEALLAGLKSKWEQVNREYQAETHITKLDSVGKIRRKEICETSLNQLEKDIAKLRRDNIAVDLTR